MPSNRRHSNTQQLADQREKMSKRTKRVDEVNDPQEPQAKSPNSIYETPGIVATKQAAAEADRHPPLNKLNDALRGHLAGMNADSEGSQAVVYWMRMQDMRIIDNRAFSEASLCAKKNQLPVVVIFAFSPGDYKAHDRAPRRIDFVLRNLRVIKDELAAMNIPLHTFTHTKRKTMHEKVLEVVQSWNAQDLFANIEYEVDELRRDYNILEPAKQAGIACHLFHDRCLVEPGAVKTKNDTVPVVSGDEVD